MFRRLQHAAEDHARHQSAEVSNHCVTTALRVRRAPQGWARAASAARDQKSSKFSPFLHAHAGHDRGVLFHSVQTACASASSKGLPLYAGRLHGARRYNSEYFGPSALAACAIASAVPFARSSGLDRSACTPSRRCAWRRRPPASAIGFRSRGDSRRLEDCRRIGNAFVRGGQSYTVFSISSPGLLEGDAGKLAPVLPRTQMLSGVLRPRPARLWWTAAPMNEANSGCGSNGRDFSSGWNCTPTNQG